MPTPTGIPLERSGHLPALVAILSTRLLCHHHSRRRPDRLTGLPATRDCAHTVRAPALGGAAPLRESSAGFAGAIPGGGSEGGQSSPPRKVVPCPARRGELKPWM